jgi:hypothetical protein
MARCCDLCLKLNKNIKPARRIVISQYSCCSWAENEIDKMQFDLCEKHSEELYRFLKIVWKAEKA